MNWKLHLCILVSIQLKFVTAQTADASASATADGASATAIATVSNMSPETIAQLGGMTTVSEAAGKAYASTSAEQNRFTIYAGNYHFVKQHNSDPVLSKHYRVAINPMSDWTAAELKQLNGARSNLAAQHTRTKRHHNATRRHRRDLPTNVDWRQEGYVTSVKDQGHCGGCWAFAAAGALEGANMAKYGQLVSLSPQDFIDCDYSNSGCDGGLPDNAFAFAADNILMGSTNTLRKYGVEWKTDSCRFSALSQENTNAGFTVVSSSDDALMRAVSSVGPVSVCIDASKHHFTHYEEGVYTGPCSSTKFDHCVLLVGYGTTSGGTDYWLLKNSWGTSWGEAGYMRLLRTGQSTCAILSHPSYPNISGGSGARTTQGSPTQPTPSPTDPPVTRSRYVTSPSWSSWSSWSSPGGGASSFASASGTGAFSSAGGSGTSAFASAGGGTSAHASAHAG